MGNIWHLRSMVFFLVRCQGGWLGSYIVTMDYMDEDLTDYKTNSSNYHGLFVYEFAHNGLCDPRHSPNYCPKRIP
jgi:hypothetical protein